MAVMGELGQAVMDILWNRPEPLSGRDVHELLAEDRDLAYTTVMTVLDRLPTNSRAAQIAAEMLDLLERLSAEERREVLAKIVPAAR